MKHIKSIVFSIALFAATQFLAAQTVFNSSPSRIVGQAVLQQTGILTASAVNLVEGRELNLPEGIALDTSASPPILYVVDAGNNRVLAWKNAFGFTKGAPQADLVVGQRDFLSTGAQGPGTNLSTGLFQPIAVAVDKGGNLYVIDAGNNRILRYPTPFSQTGDFLVPDLIIGQKNLSGNQANEGQPAPTEKTVSFSPGGSTLLAGLAFDAQGNLWVSDAGNNRVLRYPVTAIGSGAANEPAADRVLGHSDFTTVSIPPNSDPSKKNYLLQPAGLAFDPNGRLFVVDDANRVAVYAPPFVNGQLSSRIMGVILPTQQQPRPPAISESTLGFVDSNGAHPPQGVFFVNNTPYVVDSGYSRILGYDPFEQWPDENTAFSPPAKVVIGQPNFTSGQSNRGQASPSSTTLSLPVTGVFAGTDLFVVDAGNNRVVVFPQQSGSFGAANRLLAQLDFQYNAPNLIEGREFGFVTGGAAVIDASSNPPHLYVSDPVNNRVLGFFDYRKVNAGTKADLVIGQPDLLTAMVNYPSNSFTQANDSGLCSPEGLALDSNGNLYIADGCNARVLRFPSPFTQPQGILPRANLVLGQPSFFGQPIKDLSRSTMRSAYGIAFTNEGGLVVSDVQANRVLFFRKPAGDFQSAASASNVIGQRDFSSGSATTFNGPRAISIDADDQLYVADTVNSRIAIFPNVQTSGDNPPVLSSITGLSGPVGVFIDLNTDEIWVTNTNGNPNQVLRYPKYSTVINNPAPNGVISPVFGPISVTVDPFSNPVVVEAALNRVSFYYPAIDFTTSAGGVPGRLSGNAANYFQRFAPGMLSSIFAFPNKRFGDQTVINSSIPVPTTLGDIQVTVAGIPAPLLYVSPGQINFQVPGATPVSNSQEIQVTRASTGQVLASWLFRIDSVSPGLFTADATGSGQLLAVNQDGSINDATHPAKAGTYISLYGTGPGAISGLPPDGQPAQGIINTDSRPGVFINGPDFIPDGDVQFSGLAPGYVGLWQINAKIAANVPSGDVRVFIQMNGINSILDPNGIRRTTTIRVAP
jgi:uncharacterized protein (TIGR03437 family)